MRFFVTCARGTEGPLRRELIEIGARGPRGDTGGVSFEGSLELGLRVCLWSRVAMRVLLELGAFSATSADELYLGTKAIDWHAHLDAKHTLAVTATVRDNPALSHSGFAALKVKDAVVDAIRDRKGTRPDVDVDDPDLPIVLHVRGSEAKIYLDLAGEPLHRRGYRVAMSAAPLKETLAAAVLALGHVEANAPLLDPMAGSGTFAIEHALRARGMAPGRNRRFAFERWPTQAHAADWNRMKDEARSSERPQAPAPIIARDILPDAIAAARRNAEAAGVAADITFEVGGIATLQAPFPAGTLCTNPPYGSRIGGESDDDGGPAPARSGHDRDRTARSFEPRGRAEGRAPRQGGARSSGDRPRPADAHRRPLQTGNDDHDVAPLYESLTQTFALFPGWRLVVLSGNPLFSRVYLRRAEVSHKLWNGPLEARLLVYPPRA